MKSAATILGFLMASRGVTRPSQPEATPDPRRKPSILARFAARQRSQPPPAVLLSNHLRRDIGLDPIPAGDRWLDHRL